MGDKVVWLTVAVVGGLTAALLLVLVGYTMGVHAAERAGPSDQTPSPRVVAAYPTMTSVTTLTDTPAPTATLIPTTTSTATPTATPTPSSTSTKTATATRTSTATRVPSPTPSPAACGEITSSIYTIGPLQRRTIFSGILTTSQWLYLDVARLSTRGGYVTWALNQNEEEVWGMNRQLGVLPPLQPPADGYYTAYLNNNFLFVTGLYTVHRQVCLAFSRPSPFPR